ncbi:hypothetical protein ACWCXB_25705 [Streptomyces sp. NPDC001514]
MDCIARFFELLLRFLLPARGCHRGAVRPPVVGPDTPTLRLPRVHVPLLRGEDTALVRPYLVALEQRQKARLQAARRRALLFAVHGIDVEPLRVHEAGTGR